MRIAALYDIHGNLPALQAVLSEIDSLDVHGIVVGGDVIPGPLPSETLDALLELQTRTWFISGNGERETLAIKSTGQSDAPEQFHAGLLWCAEQFDATHLEFLTDLPPTIQLKIGALGDVLFCHATPQSDVDIFTRETPTELIEPIFKSCPARTVVCGHTHMHFDRVVGKTRVVNAGSVGMPFGSSVAQWLLLDGETGTVQGRSTTYDLESAATKILTSEYPDTQWFVDTHVRNSPSEAKMLEVFASVSIGTPRAGSN